MKGAGKGLFAGLALAMLLLAGRGQCAQPLAGVDVYALPDSWRVDDNSSTTLARWQGHAALATMAYSTCHHICLRTLSVLARLQDRLDKAGHPLEILVFSYDPVNDTPAVWSRYRKVHGLERGNWHFLSGTATGTARIAQVFGMDYWQDDSHILHDFRIVELDAAGHVVKTLDWGQAASGEL